MAAVRSCASIMRRTVGAQIVGADPVAAMLAAPFADQGAVLWILVAGLRRAWALVWRCW